MDPFDFTDIKLNQNKTSKPNICVVRLSTTSFPRGNSYCYCKTLTPLKKKSIGDYYNWPFEEFDDKFFERITNFNECEDGIYTMGTCNEYKDWETGCLEDWDYVLIPYIEEKK